MAFFVANMYIKEPFGPFKGANHCVICGQYIPVPEYPKNSSRYPNRKYCNSIHRDIGRNILRLRKLAKNNDLDVLMLINLEI